jgi:DNA-binding NarL/FixJ family response regulator
MTTATIDPIRRDAAIPAGSGARLRTGADVNCPAVAPVTVLIVDDDRDASYGLWALLRWRPGIRVRMSAGGEAARLAWHERPAVCLASATLGLRALHGLAQLPGAPRILVYADERSGDLEGMAIIAGAEAAMWRYGDPDELVEAIRRAASRPRLRTPVSAATVHRLIDRVDDRDRPIAALLLMRTPPDHVAWTLGLSARSLRARRREMLARLERATPQP